MKDQLPEKGNPSLGRRLTELAIVGGIVTAAIMGGQDSDPAAKSQVIESVSTDATHNYQIMQDERTAKRTMSGFWSVETPQGSSAVAYLVAKELDVLYKGILNDAQQQLNNEMVMNLTDHLEKTNRDAQNSYIYHDEAQNPVLRIPEVEAFPIPAEELGVTPNEPTYNLHLIEADK